MSNDNQNQERKRLVWRIRYWEDKVGVKIV